MRLSRLVSLDQFKLAATLLFCAPYLPLLFMGEEFAETAPFLYFTSHLDPVLAKLVTEGRRKEYAEFATSPSFLTHRRRPRLKDRKSLGRYSKKLAIRRF
jgi:maltooligosyltrehalose trehalohydrolase